MKRDVEQELQAWKESPYRKPLILKGARQVGKTWILKEFGRLHYSNVAYFSLENIAPGIPSEWAEFFEATSDPRRLVSNLSLASGIPIEPGETLIILDEIQDCEAAISSLKAFCETAPEYHVACAGSLLGIALANEESSFPVGKVNFIEMAPMSFSEFLRAIGSDNLDVYCEEILVESEIPEMIDSQLKECLQQYFTVGGMPEAVSRFIETNDVSQVEAVLHDLLDSYERDFSKHNGAAQYAKISQVWTSLPNHLSQENHKFIYGQVREGARARDYEDAIRWLVNSGLVRKVVCSYGPSIPITSNDNEAAFKLYCLDVGLLRVMSGLDATAFGRKDALYSQFKGAFAENFVLQEFANQLRVDARYWTHYKPNHEVDFLIQTRNEVIPVEVKSGENVRSDSLRYYAKKYPEETPLRVRLSMLGLTLDGNVLNIPLYLAGRCTNLVGQSLETIR